MARTKDHRALLAGASEVVRFDVGNIGHVRQTYREPKSRRRELKARVQELETDGERRDREGLLTQYAKQFTPALKEWAKSQTLDALKGFVASAPDIPGLVPARTRTSDATEGDEAAFDLGGKTWEQLSPSEKHNVFVENRALYDALKADYRRCGAPKTKGQTAC